MRMAGFLLSAAVLGGIIVYCLGLLGDAEGPEPARIAALLVSSAVAVAILCKCLPSRRPRADSARAPLPESTLGLCAMGIAAWFPVLVLFAVRHIEMPRWTWNTLGWLFFVSLVWGLFFLLFSAGIGFLALGRAKSRGAKWIVALVHLSAPMGYAAWWFTFP